MSKDIKVTKTTSTRTRPEQIKIGEVYEAAPSEAGGAGAASVVEVVVEVVQVVEVTVWAGIEQGPSISTRRVLQLLRELDE